MDGGKGRERGRTTRDIQNVETRGIAKKRPRTRIREAVDGRGGSDVGKKGEKGGSDVGKKGERAVVGTLAWFPDEVLGGLT